MGVPVCSCLCGKCLSLFGLCLARIDIGLAQCYDLELLLLGFGIRIGLGKRLVSLLCYGEFGLVQYLGRLRDHGMMGGGC